MSKDQNESELWGVVEDPNAGLAPLALKIYHQGKFLRVVRLEPDVTYIGRMPENHVVLDDPSVSRSHARIKLENTDFVYEDQESENGSYLNGKKFVRQAIKLGDQIRAGAYTLEVIEAHVEDRTAIRQDHLDEDEENEWRMDQTLSVSSRELQERMLAGAKKGTASQPRKGNAPKMKIQLEVGSKKISEEFEFKSGRSRTPQDPKEDMLHIRLVIGKWVLDKKFPIT